jgi:AcrR family transcriptional regulator
VGARAVTRSRRGRKPGRPPAKESRDRVAEIVAAARVRFVDDGFNGAALSAIAADADISLAALYHYFPNKVALFERVYSDTLSAGWEPWLAKIEELDPSMAIGDKLRAVGNPGLDARDDAVVAFFTPAQIYARRVPELRHLLDQRAAFRRSAFEHLVGSVAEEGRVRGASGTEEAVAILEILQSGWTFEVAIDPERSQEFFDSMVKIADALMHEKA